jgi:hypothetical protein
MAVKEGLNLTMWEQLLILKEEGLSIFSGDESG